MKYPWMFLCLLMFVHSQNREELKLDTTVEKTIENDRTHQYYVVIPDNTPANTQFLIFDVYPAEGDNSDPDIYVSDVPFPSL